MKLALLILLWAWAALGGAVTEARKCSWAQDSYVRKGVRNLPWVRDPFFPTEQKFKLAGIISGELAFINGKWFRKGDVIHGYRVTVVMQDSVSLAKEGEVLNLRMGD